MNGNDIGGWIVRAGNWGPISIMVLIAAGACAISHWLQ